MGAEGGLELSMASLERVCVCMCVCEEASDKLKMTKCRVVICQHGASCTTSQMKEQATGQRERGPTVICREQICEMVGESEKRGPFLVVFAGIFHIHNPNIPTPL